MSFFVAGLNRMADATAISRNKTSPAAVDAASTIGDGLISHIAPLLAAAAMVGAFAFAPVASADPGADPGPHAAPSPSQPQGALVQSGADPLVPYGTDLSTDEPYDLDPYIDPSSGG